VVSISEQHKKQFRSTASRKFAPHHTFFPERPEGRDKGNLCCVYCPKGQYCFSGS